MPIHGRRLIVLLTLFAVACAPAAPSPVATTAPAAKPTEAPKPTAAPAATTAPAAKPAAQPTAAAAAKPAASPAAAAKPAASPAATTAPAAAAKPAPATKVENSGFKNGDTIDFIVPTNAGGGYDTQGRLLAPYLEQALKQVTGADVRVIVQNVTGGEQQVGMEQVYRAKPDGKTIALFSGNINGGHQVFDGAAFDLTKMTAIGMYPPSQRSMAMAKSVVLPEKTLVALAKRSEQKPILLGHPGLEPDFKVMQLLLKEQGITLNADLVAVNGTSPLMAALLRGDIEVGWTTTAGMAKTVEDNPDKIEWLVNTGCNREIAAPTLVTVVDQKVPNAEKICATAGGGTRPIMAPPALPAPTAKALQEALRVAMDNPEHVEKGTKAGFDTAYVSPEKTLETMKTVVDTFLKYKPQLQ